MDVIKTIIIVEHGIVSGVYSTLQSKNHDIEVFDLDAFGHESPDEEDELKTRVNKIYESEKYHEIY